jgi:hypothetical protein
MSKGQLVTLSVRRSLAALAVGAALVTAGCGSSGPNRAAVVDGTVISETTLQQAMEEMNSMDPSLLQQKLTPSATLTALVQAPVVLDYLADKGVVVSDSVATKQAADRGVHDPSEGTLSIIRLAGAITAAQQSGQFADSDAIALTEQLRALDVDVNPRYGAYDPNTASIALTTPEWVEPANAAQ